MKKVKKTEAIQRRRQGALERFTINQARAKDDPDYLVRKTVEQAALIAALGHSSVS